MRNITWLLFAALLVMARPAAGQDTSIPTQRWHPPTTSGGFLMTEESAVRNLDPWAFGFWMTYAHNPLVLVDENGDIIEQVVGYQLGMDATASYAIAGWAEIGVDVPFALQFGDNPFGGDVSTGALGDIRVVPKVRILDDTRDGFGLGFIGEVQLPTHAGDFYGGARMVSFAPRLVADHRFGLTGFRFATNLGVMLRESTDLANIHAGSEFTGGLALGYRPGGFSVPWEIIADLNAGIGLGETDSEEIALEGLFGLRYDPHPDWDILLGGGVGIMEGYGVPTFRMLFGVRWEPSWIDPDRDNIPSDEDTCPEVAEDFDDDQDSDGCPEGDIDGDGVLDMNDMCPAEKETINGFEDEDGCPDEGPAAVIVEGGKITILENIQFELDSHKLKRESRPIVDQVVLTLRAHPEIKKIRIEGHTDATGSAKHNMELSKKRARAVRKYIERQGIDEERLESEGYGQERPIAPNDTPEGRAKNRRVEFVIIAQ